MWTAIRLRQIALVSRHPQMVPAVGKAWDRGVAANCATAWCTSPSGQRHWPLSGSSSEQRRISGGGTVASTGGVGFAGMIGVPIVVAQRGRVCTGFTSRCFSTPAGNKSRRRSRIAFPHTDARERFNRLEICPTDAFGPKPVSREIAWVVEGIIVNLASSP